MILAPTRELASQIVDELEILAEARKLHIAAVYGGVGFGPQIAAAKRADILVATPGRLEDLIARGAVELDQVRVLVLDEADRMLDMGFRPAVDRIVGLTPDDRQTLFFSATLEGAVGKVARDYTYGRGPTPTRRPRTPPPTSSTASCGSSRRAPSSTSWSPRSATRSRAARSSSSAPSAAPTGW